MRGLFSLFIMFTAAALISSSAHADNHTKHGASVKYNESELLSEAPAHNEFQIPAGVKLAWEVPGHPERKLWSQYTLNVVDTYFNQLDAATDMQKLCPTYRTLSHEQKVLAWGQIFAGISRFECSWIPGDHSLEVGQGVDPITGAPVYSEGLLQLSYQDNDSNPYCAFDWEGDRRLPPNDLHRSILNPYRNLYCGIRIMADLVTQNHKVIVPSGGYWSTLQSGSPHQKILLIRNMVQTLPFCISQ